MSDSGSRAVQFVFRVENEENVESADELRVREILVLVELVEHEEEVLNVVEFRVRLVVCTSNTVAIAIRSDCRDVAE